VRSAAAFCLVALAVIGCGSAPKDSSKDFKGDERAVAAVIENLESTSRKDDEAKICTKLLMPSLLDALKKQGTNCKTAVREALKDTDSFDLTVDDVTIRGTQATVKVTSGSGSDKKTDTLELERTGNAWRIVSLGS
jgi:Putative lumazine-binding